VVPENFLALTRMDCQQVFLRRLTLPVPGHRPKFSEGLEGNAEHGRKPGDHDAERVANLFPDEPPGKPLIE